MSPELLREAIRSFPNCTNSDQVLRQVAALVVPALGQWCLADRLDEPDLITRVAALGPAGPLPLPSRMGRTDGHRSSARAMGLLGRVLDAPRRMLRLSADHIEALAASADPQLRAQADFARRLGSTDVLVLGLPARGRLLGVLTLGRIAGQFDDEEIALLADLALLTGFALDDTRLLQVQRRVSTALQTSLLPPLPVLPGLNLVARYVPAGQGIEVGGDWYDAFVLPGGPAALVIGDATGHDADAATRMAELRHLLRGAAVDRGRSPAATLTQVDQVTAHLGSDASATCLYGQLHRTATTDGWQLTWSSAGHLPPLLLRGGRVEMLDTPPDLMLGVDPATSRQNHGHDLVAGDLLLLYTDGLVEDRRQTLDARLDLLGQLLVRTAGTDPEALADLLIAEMASQDDDVAVLLVSIDRPAAASADPVTARPGTSSASSPARR